MDNYSGVLIYGEISEGKLASVTLELLGIGRELADALQRVARSGTATLAVR